MECNHKNVYKIMAWHFFEYPLWLKIEWQSMDLLISTKVNTKMKMLIYFGRRFKDLWIDFMYHKSCKLISNITTVKVHVIFYCLALLRQILESISHGNWSQMELWVCCIVVFSRKHNGGSKSKLDYWKFIHGFIV
jgi:hypothetical protein